MKKSEIQLVLVVVGVLVGFLSWQFVYKNYDEKAKTLAAENETLQARVDQLEILNGRKSQYLQDMEEMKTESEAIIRRFPAGVRSEDVIMYINNMEFVDVNQVAVNSVSIGSSAEIPYEGITEVEGYTLQDEGIQMYQRQNSAAFMTTYSGLKSLLNYIYGIDTRKSVTSVNVSATEEGYLQGTLLIDFYYLNGTEYQYTETDIMGVPLGNDNFFGVRTGGGIWTAGGAESEEGVEGEAEEE